MAECMKQDLMNSYASFLKSNVMHPAKRTVKILSVPIYQPLLNDMHRPKSLICR